MDQIKNMKFFTLVTVLCICSCATNISNVGKANAKFKFLQDYQEVFALEDSFTIARSKFWDGSDFYLSGYPEDTFKTKLRSKSVNEPGIQKLRGSFAWAISEIPDSNEESIRRLLQEAVNQHGAIESLLDLSTVIRPMTITRRDIRTWARNSPKRPSRFFIWRNGASYEP
jgi:hypothetical protein